MFKFEKVERFRNVDIEAPIRKTRNSACYDMVTAETVIIQPMQRMIGTIEAYVAETRVSDEVRSLAYKMAEEHKGQAAQDLIDTLTTLNTAEVAQLTKQIGCRPTLVSTGYKAYMDEGYSLDLFIRSSSPLKYWLMLSNSTGIIDADYVDNPDNEGEIFFQVINLLPFPIKIEKGEIIGQAKFVKYKVTDDDDKQEKKERLGGFGSTTEESNE